MADRVFVRQVRRARFGETCDRCGRPAYMLRVMTDGTCFYFCRAAWRGARYKRFPATLEDRHA